MKPRLLAAALLAFAGLLLPAPAHAAACSGTAGVTVVVQFSDGHTEIGCASGDPSSGYAALQGAGFSLVYAQGSGAGAICRINGSPSDNQCGAMPPASAYWAYFHAKRGGSWTYSNVGGGSYDPKPGTVEGWRFGSGSAPGTKPPGSSESTPTPTVKPTRVPVIPPTASNAPDAPDATASSSATGPSTTPTSSSSATGTATALPSDVSNSPSGDATVSASTPITDDPNASDTSGGGISWVWGVALLVVLGVAGGATAVIRRRG